MPAEKHEVLPSSGCLVIPTSQDTQNRKATGFPRAGPWEQEPRGQRGRATPRSHHFLCPHFSRVCGSRGSRLWLCALLAHFSGSPWPGVVGMWPLWGNPELTLEGQVQVEVLGQKPLLGSKGNFRAPSSVAGTSCGIWDVLSPSLPSSEVAANIPDPGVRQASPSGQVKSTKIRLPLHLPPASLPRSCPLQFILCTAASALAKPKPVISLLGAQNMPNPTSLSQNSPAPHLCPAALSSSFRTRLNVTSFPADPFE